MPDLQDVKEVFDPPIPKKKSLALYIPESLIEEYTAMARLTFRSRNQMMIDALVNYLSILNPDIIQEQQAKQERKRARRKKKQES